jgi:hypothetical protein
MPGGGSAGVGHRSGGGTFEWHSKEFGVSSVTGSKATRCEPAVRADLGCDGIGGVWAGDEAGGAGELEGGAAVVARDGGKGHVGGAISLGPHFIAVYSSYFERVVTRQRK